MTLPVFFLATEALAEGDRLVLEGDEGRHAADVRRLRVGERLVATDGRGNSACCSVGAVGRGRVELEVLSRSQTLRALPRLIVVQALPKGDRAALAVETLTEVGVDVIVPWAARHSVTRWSAERAGKAVLRWRTAARESAKQSRRLWWPEVQDLATTEQVCGLLRRAKTALVLHEEADQPIGGITLHKSGDVLILVGPEGGIAPDELGAFVEAGGQPVRVGPTVLRTSTAGAVAAAVVLARTLRWT